MNPQDLVAQLNSEQRSIACTLDRPLFVSAGAGSGKTFTLTRRIAWALSPGSGADGKPFLDSLDQALVITFTEAAAREIRERVRQTLREAGKSDEHMREAALEVDGAWISTIHGMCSRILHRHALDLGLDPSFEVAGESVESELFHLAMDQVMREALEEEAYRAFFAGDVLGGYSDTLGFSGRMGLVARAFELGARCPQGLAGLAVPTREAAETSARDSMARLLMAAESLAACKLTPKAQEAIEPVLDALRSFDALPPAERTPERTSELLGPLKLPRKSKACAEEHAVLTDALARARIDAALAQEAQDAAAAIELARRVEAAYAEAKRDAAVLTNDDLINLALVAVRDHPEIARDYTRRFRLVMVDEFQDTDERQLQLISLLAGEGARHLCTVGDAQQSIYRFRGADVDVFRRQGRNVAPEGHVQLATNYRSHADVLSLVERICGGRPTPGGATGDTGGAMGDTGGAASADDTATQPAFTGGVLADYMHLDASPTRRDGWDASARPRIALEVTSGPGVSAGSSAAQSMMMATQVADRLAQLAAEGVRAGKMALLLGVTTHAGAYIDALRARGIECVVTGGSTFTSSVEAEVMCALLHTLANPADTQSGLFRLLSSEVFELDATDFCLLGTRLSETSGLPVKRTIDRGLEQMDLIDEHEPSARLRLAHVVLTRAWDDMRSLPVADVCLRVVRDSGWLARLEASGSEGLARAANVLAALRYIRDLTSDLGLGPARAAVEFDRWLALVKLPPATLSGGVADTLRVMTVHASKGLEFPVVAVAECWRDAKTASGIVAGASPAAAALGLPEGSWLALKAPGELSKLTAGLIDDGAPTLKGAAPSLVDAFLELREELRANDQAEKARLLYVALTRAEEALVVGVAAPCGKEGVSYQLAAGSLRALAEPGEQVDELLLPGERELAYGGTAPAVLRVVSVSQKRDKASGLLNVQIDSAESLAGFDGAYACESVPPLFEQLTADVLQDAAGDGAAWAVGGGGGAGDALPGASDAAEASDGATRDTSTSPFVLYEQEGEPSASLASWRAREGVFSYSSAHQLLEQEGALPDLPAETPPPRQTLSERVARYQAVEDDAPTDFDDADKATNLGSAFHELAQMMVESGCEPTREQRERMVRYWHLSPRAAHRLDEALDRWVGSDIRREALTYDLLRAEVPFFVPATPGLERFGQQMEGAIDLLCCKRLPDGTLSPEVLLIDYKTGDRKLTPEQIRARHAMQADFYASVLRSQGFERITCAFVCVEIDAGELADATPSAQPHVVRYTF